MTSTDTGDSVKTISLAPKHKRDYRFKYVLICLCFTLFLSALEFTAVSTALPTIVLDLKGSEFIWVTSAYGLTSVAVIPLIGGLAEMFGRKPTTLLVILCFAVGSAVCGGAQNMTMLITGRAIQGLGGGAIVVITNIILADMIPLDERGGYGGLFSLTWCLAAALGALIGGVLTQTGQWRWLFCKTID
ncbi:hypothetical protein Clacol_008638 [Clathrus columnatus]|uniref:Major facilitator superfamily (MFS) profile domain-containing protein n=1 Tax=Clathrus columnatus TaxID=1419009 RepID=A0AAV5AMM4_9AGAM|nr:hypothetical protein Clacol_008638 [Clathrus columnatus]